MREIEFRGKSVEHNVWVYGYYIKAIGDLIVEKRSSISTMEYVVEENSVGQFTGLRDKHGVKIYEGDIVKIGTIEKYFNLNSQLFKTESNIEKINQIQTKNVWNLLLYILQKNYNF